ncbi:uncharacterized protein G2W53_010122 [Senna tora]|uniref:Uncharacterized protein n=1 Tax=Senna tora TaxID=362788 RepID=A0A834WZK3_9FABA|nr:uncharacterized protein G2W53_010122 [Senna tora]
MTTNLDNIEEKKGKSSNQSNGISTKSRTPPQQPSPIKNIRRRRLSPKNNHQQPKRPPARQAKQWDNATTKAKRVKDTSIMKAPSPNNQNKKVKDTFRSRAPSPIMKHKRMTDTSIIRALLN